MHGLHLIDSWSSTQGCIALSSCEAEYYAAIDGASRALAMQSLCRDLNAEVGVRLLTDSSAAKGLACRRGLSTRVRHLEVKFLWLQEAVKLGHLKLKWIPGKGNPAGALTKYLNRGDISRMLDRVHCKVIDGS